MPDFKRFPSRGSLNGHFSANSAGGCAAAFVIGSHSGFKKKFKVNGNQTTFLTAVIGHPGTFRGGAVAAQ